MRKPKEQPAFNLGLEGEEKPKAPPPHTLEGEKLDCIEELVGALFDPIIVMEPGWDVPDWIRKEMPLARLAQNMKALKDPAEAGLASELEAMLYLSNASLVAPMSSHWQDIYMWIFTKVMRARGNEVPADLARESIDSYEQGLYRDLRRWIWERRVKARKERAAKIAAEDRAPAAAEPEETAQARFF